MLEESHAIDNFVYSGMAQALSLQPAAPERTMTSAVRHPLNGKRFENCKGSPGGAVPFAEKALIPKDE